MGLRLGRTHPTPPLLQEHARPPAVTLFWAEKNAREAAYPCMCRSGIDRLGRPSCPDLTKGHGPGRPEGRLNPPDSLRQVPHHRAWSGGTDKKILDYFILITIKSLISRNPPAALDSPRRLAYPTRSTQGDCHGASGGDRRCVPEGPRPEGPGG